MLKEIKSGALYCYRDDKKRFAREIIAALVAVAAGILLVIVATGIWG